MPLSREIFIFIADRLTAAERAFSTPPQARLSQSSRERPAILVHADAASTCIVLVSPSRSCASLRTEGRVYRRVSVRTCVPRARARVDTHACSSRQSVSIRERETLEKAALSLDSSSARNKRVDISLRSSSHRENAKSFSRSSLENANERVNVSRRAADRNPFEARMSTQDIVSKRRRRRRTLLLVANKERLVHE